MSNKDDLKLFGSFASPYVFRIKWALKLKNLEYEYIEEDLSNKSDSLLKYNSIHQKVPVLVHRGKPIMESVVILEYIEETWPGVRPLFPSDPFERARSRFWTKFCEEQDVTFFKMFSTTGEEQVKAVENVREVLRILENEGLGDERYFGGNEVGITDLVFGWMACWLEILEEASGVKVMNDSDGDFSKLKAWFIEFRRLDVVKKSLPDEGKMLAHFKRRREMLLKSSTRNRTKNV